MSGEPAIQGPGAVQVTLTVNSRAHTLLLEPRTTLLDLLRDELRLTGAKRACDHGNCGTCTVIVDGRAVYACLLLAIAVQGREITTIEALNAPEALHPLQQAFIQHDAFQCGYCTPGQIMSLCALLQAEPNPTEDQVRRAVSGNLCRCAAYPNIVRAGLAAAATMRERAR